MIRHVLLFRFRPGLSEPDREDLLGALRALPRAYPTMQRFSLAANQSRRDSTFTHAMHIEFATWDELEAYLDSPGHEALVRDRFAPRVDARAIASIDDRTPPAAPSVDLSWRDATAT